MSELQNLATKINKAQQNPNNLTDKDIKLLSEALERAQANSGVKAVELAAITATKEATTQLRRRIPNTNQLKNALFNSNPIILGAVDMFRNSVDAMEKQEKVINKTSADQVKELGAKLKELQKLTKVQGEDSVERQKSNTTVVVDSFQHSIEELRSEAQLSRFLLEEAVEQLKYSNNLDENILDENRRSKLAGLGVDSEDIVSPTNTQLIEVIEDLKEEVAKQGGDPSALNTLFAGATALGVTLTGLFTGSGLFAASGPLVKGFKTVMRVGTKFLGPLFMIGVGLKGFYDGFNDAADIFGENASLLDKLRAGVSGMVSALFSPIDDAIEFFTGERTDISGFLSEMSLKFSGALVKNITQAYDSTVAFLKQAFQGITTDTNLTDIPSMIWNNISETVKSGLERLGDDIVNGFKSSLDFIMDSDLFESFSTIPDMITSVKESISNSISAMYNDMIDSLIEKTAPFSDFITEQLESLKVAPAVVAVEAKANPNNLNIKDTRSNYVESVRPEMIKLVEKAESTNNYDDTRTVEAIKELKQAMGENNKQLSQYIAQPVQASSQTTVVSGKMSTYPGIRNSLVPNH